MKYWLFLPLALTAATPAVAASHLTLRVTAYCAGPCRRCGTTGITATGRNALRTHGVAVAVSSRGRAVPLGRRVFLRGLGWLPVDDTGSGVRRNQLDLRFHRHQDAKRWGVRVLRVAVKR